MFFGLAFSMIRWVSFVDEIDTFDTLKLTAIAPEKVPGKVSSVHAESHQKVFPCGRYLDFPGS